MKKYQWKKCKFEIDRWGMYITPMIGYDTQSGSIRFWFGWLWFLFTFEPKETK